VKGQKNAKAEAKAKAFKPSPPDVRSSVRVLSLIRKRERNRRGVLGGGIKLRVGVRSASG